MQQETPVQQSAAWTVRRIFFATMTVLCVVAVFALFYRFYMVVFLFFIAFSLAVVIEPLVTWLHRRGLRREISPILIYIMLAIILAVTIWALVPMLIEQGRGVAENVPQFYASMRESLREHPIGLVRGIYRVLPVEIDLAAAATRVGLGGAVQAADPLMVVANTARVLFAVVAVFLMAYFWTLEGDRIIRRLILQAPAARRDGVRTIIGEVHEKIYGYFRGQLILCSSIGLLSLVSFLLLGIPNALVLALFMAIFEAVPVVGPFLGAIPALIMTASVDPSKVVWVIGSIIVIQVVESNFMVPRVMDRAVGVNAVVSLLAIAAFGALFGFAGALLAVPLAAVLQILFSRLVFEPPENPPFPALAAGTQQRDQMAVLQLQAQELASDARKMARTDIDPAGERTLDEIELIARSLGSYLADRGQKP